MNFLRTVGKWLARATDVASRLLYQALSASDPNGATGFDVFGRRMAAAAVWALGALIITLPSFSLAQPLSDVMFRTGTTMWYSQEGT